MQKDYIDKEFEGYDLTQVQKEREVVERTARGVFDLIEHHGVDWVREDPVRAQFLQYGLEHGLYDKSAIDSTDTKFKQSCPTRETLYKDPRPYRRSDLGRKIRRWIISLGIVSIGLIGGYHLKEPISTSLFGKSGPTQFDEVIDYKFEYKRKVYSGEVRRKDIIRTDDGKKFKILGDAAWPLDNSGKIPYRRQSFETSKSTNNLERRVERATSELITIRESDRSESYKRGEIARVKRTYGQDLMLRAMRKVPLYDEESGRLVTMDRWARDFTSTSGVNPDIPFARDPVGQAFDLLFGNKDPVEFAMENYTDTFSSSSSNESLPHTYVEARVDTYDPVKEAEKRSARKAAQREEEERQRNYERSIEERREMREQTQRDMERATERARETTESARESVSESISEIQDLWRSSDR